MLYMASLLPTTLDPQGIGCLVFGLSITTLVTAAFPKARSLVQQVVTRLLSTCFDVR
jgi:hypothetical protein